MEEVGHLAAAEEHHGEEAVFPSRQPAVIRCAERRRIRRVRQLHLGPRRTPFHIASGRYSQPMARAAHGPVGWWRTSDSSTSGPIPLAWSTEPLTENLTISGDIVAHLFASTTGSDSDWIVKLIDVYPEVFPGEPRMAGFQLMVANEVLRGRFRKSFEKPEPLVPHQPTEFTIDLHPNDHTFLQGHRIMVQVQSTWFPLIDRNPQKFVPNIFLAEPGDFQKATQRVYRSAQYPSSVALPVVIK